MSISIGQRGFPNSRNQERLHGSEFCSQCSSSELPQCLRLEEMYGIEVSPTLISNVTDAEIEEVKLWQELSGKKW